MSQTPDHPASIDTRREVLETNREIFETIRDGDDISPELRRRFGERPLEYLSQLQEAADGD